MQLRAVRVPAWLRDLALVAAVVLAVRAYQQRSMPTGAAPALYGTDLAGQAVDLASYRGKPLIVHFFATWCGVCRAVEPNIDAVARDLPVLAVATNSGSSARVSAYARARGLVPRVLVDESGELRNRYGVQAYPTTFVLDAEGRIRHVEVGYTSEFGLRARTWLVR